MKTLVKIFALVVMLVGTTQLAHASSLYGSITFKGGAVLGSSSITFQPLTDKLQLNGTGSFAGFTAGTAVTFTHVFTFAGISAPGGEQLFTVRNSTNSQALTFVVTSYTVLPGTGKFIFYGTLTLSNVDPVTHLITTTISTTTGAFNYTQNIPLNDFNGSMTLTPEPNSLMLLGTGLVGAAATAMKRRRRMAGATASA